MFLARNAAENSASAQLDPGGKCVVTALDYVPDVCVETAAGQPILDASPLVGNRLFGESGVG